MHWYEKGETGSHVPYDPPKPEADTGQKYPCLTKLVLGKYLELWRGKAKAWQSLGRGRNSAEY